jgi:hypothetical protein
LRRDLSARNQQIAITSGSVHQLTAGEMPSVIFGRKESHQHGNFHPASYLKHLRKPRMGAPSDQGPYRVAKITAHSGLAMDGTRLREQDWVGEIGKGRTTVTVKVRHPEVTHIVKMIQDFEKWLNRGFKSPAETVLKARLRQMLGMRKQS